MESDIDINEKVVKEFLRKPYVNLGDRDICFSSFSKQKADVLFQELVTLTEAINMLENVSSNIAETEDTENFMGFSQDPKLFIAVLEELLVDDYEPPSANATGWQIHLWCLWEFYAHWAQTCPWMPPEVIFKLDVVSFKLLACVGMFKGVVPEGVKKIPITKAKKEANYNQKSKTLDTILKAYKEIGVEWSGGNPKKPFKIGDKVFSKNGIAGKIFIHLKSSVTQTHIANRLKELREKGEI